MSAIEKLKEGFKSFRDGYFRENKAVYNDLFEHGQAPKIAMISCADSRIDPSTVLGAGPGELFTIRNVANLVPPYEEVGSYHGTSSALQYAVQHLHVEHIVVLGHAHCGGVQSLFNADTADDDGATTNFISSWTSMLKPAYLRVMATMPNASEREKQHVCERGAVLVSLENLMTFDWISEKVSAGDLTLHGWHIDAKEGVLTCYNADTQQFEAVD